ncbi:unnamed protein product [Brassica rapa subsp. narinosa]
MADIFVGRDLLLKGLGQAIGNRTTTSVWRDHWLGSLLCPTPYGLVQEKNMDLIVADLLTRESRTWNISRIQSILPHHLHDIQKIRPRILEIEDSYVWLDAKSGVYSTKSRRLASGSEPCDERRKWSSSMHSLWRT